MTEYQTNFWRHNCVCTLTRDHEDLGLDVEGAGDHEEAARVGVEPPRGCVQAPALAMT